MAPKKALPIWKITSCVVCMYLVYAFMSLAIYQRQPSTARLPDTLVDPDHGVSADNSSRTLTSTAVDPDGTGADPDLSAVTRRILLLTYYRGGSTFLGEIFAQNPDTFYWFEPIRGLLGNLYGDLGDYKPRIKHFLNLEEHYTRLSNGSLEELSRDAVLNRSRVISDIFAGRVSSLPQWLLGDSFVKEASHMSKIKPFAACISFMKDSPKNRHRCLRLLSTIMGLYPITVIKTIRLPVYALADLFDLVPDAYVIYYVRDPRGIMASRKELHHFRMAHLSIFARNLCDAMARNHEHFVRLKKLYPNRLAFFRYEDLALNTDKLADQMYKFAGLPMPYDVIAWIRQNTADGRKIYDAFDTKRNSTETAAAWRYKLNDKEKSAIADKCKNVMEMYGYK